MNPFKRKEIFKIPEKKTCIEDNTNKKAGETTTLRMSLHQPHFKLHNNTVMSLKNEVTPKRD